ncbi:MAG: hypothetical protein SFY80_06675 [Verrucomicrobiota bacterium]|nr:hypothetical protein [Verrucomicrobiota bacterium]
MRINVLFFASILLLLVGCTTTTKHAQPIPDISAQKPRTPEAVLLRRDQLVGTWYGDQSTKEGGRVQWIMSRSVDGTFRVSFRSSDLAGNVKEQTEVGTWGVNADMLITLTRGWIRNGRIVEAPRADSYFWDVYIINDIDADSINYTSVEGGNQYRVKRVSSGFKFPE